MHSDTEDGLMFLPELQWRQWTQEDLAMLLLAGLLERPCPAAQFPLLFIYFDKVREGNYDDTVDKGALASSSTIHYCLS